MLDASDRERVSSTSASQAVVDSGTAQYSPSQQPRVESSPSPIGVSKQMQRRSTVRWAARGLAVDAAMVTLAVLTVGITAFGRESLRGEAELVVLLPLVLVFLYSRGMYRYPLHLRALDSVRVVVIATTVSIAILISAHTIIAPPMANGVVYLRVWLAAIALLVVGRVWLLTQERRARRRSGGGRRTLVIGAGRVGNRLASRLLERPDLGLLPIGFLDKEPLAGEEVSGTIPIVGASWDLEQVVDLHGIEQVVFTFSTAPTDVLLDLVRRSEQLGVGISFIPRLFERSTEQFTVESIGGIPLVTGHSPRPNSWQFGIKYAFDRVAAGVGLVVLLPIFGACALAVLCSLGRPILYRAERVGRDGAKFEMLKFRTMHGRPETDPEKLAIRSDTGTSGAEESARLSRVGLFMRRHSIDELPQLLNVLNGDMSLVGPRPERSEYVEVLERTVYRYDERHRVKSGITGWAQVNGLRGQTSLADRVEWDNYYIENWSFWLDIKILLLTLATPFSPRNAD